MTTIVLVHGALTDASVWNGVAARLRRNGYTTIAPAIPLRGLHSDAAYLSAFLDSIDGPKIVVGHSYGGSVISCPSIAKPEVKALVFAAAFMPDAGETTGELNGRWPGGKLGEATVLVRSCPGGNDLYLKPEEFANVYAGDLPGDIVAQMAATQRPIDPAALDESFDGVPAWRSVPSWALISTRDDSLPPAAQRYMAKRASSTVVEVTASHASPVSQPEALADLIVAATRNGAQNQAA